jgi:hypothetical protein
MSIPAFVNGFLSRGYHTESSGTAIEENLPANSEGRMALMNLEYTGGGTAHTLSLMYADGAGSRNTCDGGASSGQKDLTTVDDPKDPAGNAAASGDVVAYKVKDGTWEFNTVDSVSSKTITFNNNISTEVLDGAEVNIIGAQGDGAEFQLLGAASSQAKFGEGNLYIVHPYEGEPMHFYSPNGTDAGSLDNLLVAFINK